MTWDFGATQWIHSYSLVPATSYIMVYREQVDVALLLLVRSREYDLLKYRTGRAAGIS